MRRLRIAVDMDEVLADALGKQLRSYNERFGATVTTEELHGLELADIVPHEHQPWVLAMLHEPGFFADLEWIPGAREEMEKLCAAHDIFIASAATEFPTSFVDKLNWLEQPSAANPATSGGILWGQVCSECGLFDRRYAATLCRPKRRRFAVRCAAQSW